MTRFLKVQARNTRKGITSLILLNIEMIESVVPNDEDGGSLVYSAANEDGPFVVVESVVEIARVLCPELH